MFDGLAVGTRFFDNRPGSSPEKILVFARRMSEMVKTVIVAVNEIEDKSGAMIALDNLGLDNLMVIGVKPWVKFVQPMNVILDEAAHGGFRYLLSCSPEICIVENQIRDLMGYMDDNTLCVGPRLPEHEFSTIPWSPYAVKATGINIPWNTYCIWCLERFASIGFPLVGDAAFDPTRKMAGVEELAAIAVMQNLYSEQECQVKLVQIPVIDWQTDFVNDPIRRKKHEQKLCSKKERPAEQLRSLKLKNAPIVWHWHDIYQR